MEYEIVAKFCNACAGTSRPQTFFEEATLRDPADYVRQKHARDFDKFVKSTQEDGRVLYSFNNGSVMYTYEFTPLDNMS